MEPISAVTGALSAIRNWIVGTSHRGEIRILKRKNLKLRSTLNTYEHHYASAYSRNIELQRQLDAAHARIADLEHHLAERRCHAAGLLAEVRALMSEARACPHAEHHTLCNSDGTGRPRVEQHYVTGYEDLKAEILGSRHAAPVS